MLNTLCPLPWKHISTTTSGSMRACCQCIYEPFGILKKENGENYHAARDSFLDARNSEVMKNMRKEMLEGKKPEICKLCWMEESVGAQSRRQWELYRDPGFIKKAFIHANPDGSIDHEKFPLTYIDLRLGNQCNLKCRYCGPTDSNSWYGDFVKFNLDSGSESPNTFNMYGQDYELKNNKTNWTVNSDDFNWPQNPKFLEMIENIIEHSETFYFTGGEPLILQAHWDLLSKCIDKGRASQICLEYNSNLTHLNDKHLEIWKHFKAVGIGCSIDGIDQAASYLRPPVEWSKIENNLFKIANAPFRIDAIFSTTLSVFNVLKFQDIIEYSTSMSSSNFFLMPNSHFLEHPAHYSMKILPSKAKEKVIASYQDFEIKMKSKLNDHDFSKLQSRINAIKTYLLGEDRSSLIKDFYRYTETLDKIRGQNFSDIFPEVHELLQMK